MVGEPVDQGRGHLGVAEGQIGGDDHRGLFVELADQMEQALTAGLGERQIAQLVEAHEIETGELAGQDPCLAAAGLVLQLVDQIDGVEAPARTTLAVMAMARWVLPAPVPPTRTMLRWLGRKAPSCSERTRPSLIGEPSKTNAARSGEHLDPTRHRLRQHIITRHHHHTKPPATKGAETRRSDQPRKGGVGAPLTKNLMPAKVGSHLEADAQRYRRQTVVTGRVEDGRGGNAPFPVPAHQTGRADFRHPAFRLASPHSYRWRPNVHASQAQDTALPMNIVVGEAARAAPRLFVPSRKEVPDAVVDMLVNCPVRLQAGAIAEVRRPTAQQAVQSVPHLGPGPNLAG